MIKKTVQEEWKKKQKKECWKSIKQQKVDKFKKNTGGK
jgi:hypothetical protein